MCVQDGLAASVCVSLTYAASIEYLPQGWRVAAFPRGFMFKAARLGSFSVLFVVPSAARVYETGLPLLSSVCLRHTSTASVEPLPWGFRAVASPR